MSLSLECYVFDALCVAALLHDIFNMQCLQHFVDAGNCIIASSPSDPINIATACQDVFPKEVFQSSGAKLLQPDYAPKYKAIYREADLEAGQAIAR